MIRSFKLHPVITCLLLFIAINLIFFHPMLSGFVPMPFDHLVGALYPWYDYKWGYGAGVPIRNPGLSDVFSDIYPWRSLSANLIKSGHLPLWNSFEFSGTPLLANLQSAALYPLIILMIIFGNLWGYSLMLFFQPLLSMIFMFLYLREIKVSYSGAFLGAVLFAYSGFMLTYLELATATQVFMWTPLLLFFLERFFRLKKFWWLIPIPVIEFFCLTGGHFQTVFYQFGLVGCYILFLFFKQKVVKPRVVLLSVVLAVLILGALLASAQIFPTLEFQSLSIRTTDQNISQYHNGLIPLSGLITFLAPDFFGNPATYNFWGFLGYQEVTFYFGAGAFLLFLGALFFKDKRTDSYRRFFIVAFVISCLLIFNTPIGSAIYFFKVPIFSTSYASRLIVILDFAAICLLALNFEKLLDKRKELLRLTYLGLGLLGVLGVGILVVSRFLHLDVHTAANLRVSLKNLALPVLYLVIFGSILKLVNNHKLRSFLIIGFMVFDILRFGMKFTPFSEAKFAFPNVPTITFLQQNIGNDRMERERTEVMPPNTWVPYGLQSPSGYDPLYTKSYSNFYNVYNDHLPDESVSTRYAELMNYYSPFIDLVGVKYLVTVKRDSIARVDKTATSSATWFNQPRFEKVFSDQSMVVLQNKDVMQRVNLFDLVKVESNQHSALVDLVNGLDFKNIVTLDSAPAGPLSKNPGDSATIFDYQSDRVTIKTVTKNPTMLMLSDENYPGWKATINGNATKIYLADGEFRAVYLPAGQNTVVFSYLPASFTMGVKVGLVALGLLVLLFLGLAIFF